MAITSAICTSAKADFLSGLHCFNAVITFTANNTNTQFTYTSLSALTGLAVGMDLSGAGITAGAVIASVDSATQITASKAGTGTVGGTITATGDSFKLALIKVSPAGTYGAASVNYTDITGNSDEVTGTAYVAGGTALTNVTPTTSGTTAYIDFADPSWAAATISTTGCMIYNTKRRGPVATPSVMTLDFGGTQTVTAGTLTIIMPAPASSTAILRIA